MSAISDILRCRHHCRAPLRNSSGFPRVDPTSTLGTSSQAVRRERALAGGVLEARRSSQLFASTSYSTADDVGRTEAQFHRQLLEHARAGEAGSAQTTLSEMVSQGLSLTPEAYHGLIFSHMRAGNSEGALNALYAALDTSAIVPLAASYAVVIYACTMDGDIQAAETVYNLVAAGQDRFPSWLAYLKGLVSYGLLQEDKDDQLEITDLVEEVLEEGQREGWYPDPDLFEDVLGLLCEDPKKALAAEDLLYEVLEKREGAETRHYNCILRAQAIWMGVHNARKLMDDMIEGKTGGKRRVLPDVESYNALVEGCLIERMQGFSYAVADLESVLAETMHVGIQLNKRTHTLLLMFYMAEGKIDRVLYELRETERLAAPGRVLEHLTNEWLGRLVEFMLREKCVLEIARLMFLLNEDGRSLPPDVFMLDSNGQSFHTRWLPAFFAGMHFNRRTEGLGKYAEVADAGTDAGQEDNQLVDDMYLNANNAAVDESTGAEMSVADMSASQMKTELEAKGLPTAGLKQDLVRRVQQSRGTQPIPVQELMQRRRSSAMASASLAEERKSEQKVMEGMKRVAQYKTEWSAMGEEINTVERVTFVIDPASEAREKDREHLASLEAMDLPPETKELLKERRIAFNTQNTEAEFMLDHLLFDTEDPEFLALNPNFFGREGYGIRMMWPKFGRASRLALYMMEMSESLGGGAALNDFIEIQEACIEEEDAETGFTLFWRFHPHSDKVEPQTRSLFYNKTLHLCMSANRLDLASAVGEAMQEIGMEPQGLYGDEGTLPALREYGNNMHSLIHDLRVAAKKDTFSDDDEDANLDADAESSLEAARAEAARSQARELEAQAEDSSGDEQPEAWEQGVEEDDPSIVAADSSQEEGEEEEEEEAAGGLGDFAYVYPAELAGEQYIVSQEEMESLVEAGLVELREVDPENPTEAFEEAPEQASLTAAGDDSDDGTDEEPPASETSQGVEDNDALASDDTEGSS